MEQQSVENGVAKTELPSRRALRQGAASAPASGTPIFDVKNVSIWYSDFKAVTNVSLPIYEREITAFIGWSGSGKTTVLRSFNRMNDLVPGARLEGEIDYRGESLYGPGLPDRGATTHRDGLPEAEPVPEIYLRQRCLRAAHQQAQRRARRSWTRSSERCTAAALRCGTRSRTG